MSIFQNCWEFKKCGRQVGGEKVGEFGICPAVTDNSANTINHGKNGGRICWAISGTFCNGEKQGTYAKKCLTCVACDFFNFVQKEEGHNFVLLKPGQDYTAWKRVAEKPSA
ncbi:MAG: two-CW domain-containing protein [Promethearchaeota archaeon]